MHFSIECLQTSRKKKNANRAIARSSIRSVVDWFWMNDEEYTKAINMTVSWLKFTKFYKRNERDTEKLS